MLFDRMKVVIAGAAALLVAACQTPSSGPPAGAVGPAAGPVAAAPDAAPPAPGEFRLGTRDELKVTVFGEPELSGNFIVDEKGDISMSLIGEVRAAGRTLRQLQRDIEQALIKGEIMRNPQVSAEVVNYRPFYVSGEVNKPGDYPYIAGLTLRNAILIAGDFTYRADKRKVVIKPAGSGEEYEMDVTASATINPGDTINVRECFILC